MTNDFATARDKRERYLEEHCKECPEFVFAGDVKMEGGRYFVEIGMTKEPDWSKGIPRKHFEDLEIRYDFNSEKAAPHTT